MHHFNSAASKTKTHRPKRAGTSPVEYVFNGRDVKTRFHDIAYSHSKAPFFHSYTKPTVSKARKIPMIDKPGIPSSRNTTAQGTKNAVSKSKMMKRIATR